MMFERVSWRPYLFGGLIAVALGASAVASPTGAFLLIAVVVGGLSICAPATNWAIAAVIFAVVGRAFAYLGAPSITSYLDIPLAWGALAAALLGITLRRHPMPRSGRRLLLLFGLFVIAATISGLFAHSQFQRIVFFVALWGEPWAVLVALLIDPPNPSQRRTLVTAVAALLLIQVPIAWYQGVSTGFGGGGDYVQGTAIGSGAGANLVGAIAVMGAMWIASLRPLKRTHLLAIVLLSTLPIMAGAKLVLVAVPATVLLAGWSDRRYPLARVLIIGLSVYGVFFYAPGGSGNGTKQLANATQTGKVVAAKQIWSSMHGSLPSIAVGLGPAMTFTHAAFLTTDPLTKPNSPLAPLHVTPSTLAYNSIFVQAAAEHTSNLHAIDSFHSQASSLIGLFGDLGVLGTLAFAAMLAYVVRALRAIPTPTAAGAMYALTLVTLLALGQDFWEESAVTMFLACLLALGLTSRKHPDA